MGADAVGRGRLIFVSTGHCVAAGPLVSAISPSDMGLAYLADEAVSDIDTDKTPILSSRQSSNSLSDASTTASSVYSSASSMARSRAVEVGRISFDGAKILEGNPEAECAPYLVPRHGPELTLAWQPDPESQELDPAEEVWKRLEAKLGRGLRGDTVSDRGRWIVHALSPVAATPRATDYGGDLVSMEKTLSDFSVSDYTSMSSDDAGDSVPTALFDMTGPLIPSISSSAATPANTPYLDRESLHRSRHVRRKGDSRAMSRKTSMQTSTSELQSESLEQNPAMDGTSVRIPVNPSRWVKDPPATALSDKMGMFRLDSHVVSALQALQGDCDSPGLDLALGLTEFDPVEVGDVAGDAVQNHLEGGLGLGMHIRNDSIYSLSTVSQWRRRCAQPSKLPDKRTSDRQGATRTYDPVEDGSRGHEPVMVTDLDTGVMRALTLRRGGD